MYHKLESFLVKSTAVTFINRVLIYFPFANPNLTKTKH